MFAIEVEYLLRRAIATDTSQRNRHEWPPHPTRLFSALVDALSDVDEDEMHTRCECALLWLERAPPPWISASLEQEASVRTLVKFFVPINDEIADPKRMRPTPIVDLRPRQERYFPAVVPADPRVVFAWPDAQPSYEEVEAIDELVRRVSYLGHSSSIVRVRCKREATGPFIVPAEQGRYPLRVPGPGRLERLMAVHQLRKKDTYVQAPRGKELFYARQDDVDIARSPFGEMRVLVFVGARFGLHETAFVTQRFREALFYHLPDAKVAPESLTGHLADRRPSSRPHLALIPLANVASRRGKYPDGSIKGLGVVLPQEVDKEIRLLLETALAKIDRLVFGARGEVKVAPASAGDDRPYSLDPTRYQKQGTVWASVTPIVLGRHAKQSKGLTEEEIVRRHVTELGLPAPREVYLGDASLVLGTPRAHAFHRGKLSALQHGRALRHAIITFDRRIRGPLIVGAGCYMGFGLMMPWENSQNEG